MTDIFQSPGDRLRFEILLKSLTEGSINLAVLSEHDMVLDYYGNLFEERLRAHGNHKVEFCFSTNSERLIQKFNEILSELTLNQALEKDKKHAPRRFLIFRESILMQDFELQLLARLVNGFPAGNINVILLINSAADYRSKITAFGKNLLEWEVETQAGDAKKPLTDWVSDSQTESAPLIEPTLTAFSHSNPDLTSTDVTTDSLALATKTSWRVPSFDQREGPVALTTPTITPSLDEMSREPTLQSREALPATSVPEVDALTRPKKSFWGWIVLTFLLSLATFGWMYQDVLMQEVESFKKYLLRGTPAAVISAQDAALAASTAAASEAAAVDAEAPKTVQEAASSPEEPATPDVATKAASDPSLTSSAPPASAVVPSVAVELPKVVDKPLEKAADKPIQKPSLKAVEPQPKLPVSPPANPKAKRSDDAWLDDLPVNGFVVQLGAFDTQAEAAAFQKRNAMYASARIARAPKQGAGGYYYILLSPSFANKAQADAFMQSSPLFAKGWLRSVKSVKTQYNKP